MKSKEDSLYHDPEALFDDRPASEMAGLTDWREYKQPYQDILYKSIGMIGLQIIIDSVKEVRYEALDQYNADDDERLKSGAAGKTLFEYNKTPLANGEVRLWVDIC